MAERVVESYKAQEYLAGQFLRDYWPSQEIATFEKFLPIVMVRNSPRRIPVLFPVFLSREVDTQTGQWFAETVPNEANRKIRFIGRQENFVVSFEEMESGTYKKNNIIAPSLLRIAPPLKLLLRNEKLEKGLQTYNMFKMGDVRFVLAKFGGERRASKINAINWMGANQIRGISALGSVQ